MAKNTLNLRKFQDRFPTEESCLEHLKLTRFGERHECEKCGEPASRQLNAPAIAFKGSGWYKTDSRASDNIGTDRNKKKPKPEVATPGSDSSSAKRSATGTSQAKSETTNSNSSSSAKKGAKSD